MRHMYSTATFLALGWPSAAWLLPYMVAAPVAAAPVACSVRMIAIYLFLFSAISLSPSSSWP